jgi:hypothetical protein
MDPDDPDDPESADVRPPRDDVERHVLALLEQARRRCVQDMKTWLIG